jgi:hypothetical protein|tara:strand:- start:51 stop:218 length:168 start_codon:yes stop_codon:yes gene_type:complete
MITNKELKQYLEEIVKRYESIEQRLDRIEQLVMKFWDVPESGFDILDEESEQPQK